jgi:hypothetical protein
MMLSAVVPRARRGGHHRGSTALRPLLRRDHHRGRRSLDGGTEEIARRYADNVLVGPLGASRRASTPVCVPRAVCGSCTSMPTSASRPRSLEIREALATSPDVLAFRSPTINFFWGRRMEHGGWGTIMQQRLVRREHAQVTGRGHPSTGVPPDRIGTCGRALALLAPLDRGGPPQGDPLRPAPGTGSLRRRSQARHAVDVRPRHGARVRPPHGPPDCLPRRHTRDNRGGLLALRAVLRTGDVVGAAAGRCRPAALWGT